MKEENFVSLMNHAPTHNAEQDQDDAESGDERGDQAHHSDRPVEMESEGQ